MRAAAEAMIEALVLDGAEGGGLFIVEGAEPDIFAAAPGELDAPPDNRGQRYALAQLIEEAGRKGHELLALSCQLSATNRWSNECRSQRLRVKPSMPKNLWADR